MLTNSSVLILLTSFSALVMLSSVSVLVQLNGVFLGGLTLIWSIMMLECISKIPVDYGYNHLMRWGRIYV